MPLDHANRGEVAAPNLAALSIEQVAGLLRRAGAASATPERIHRDIAAGAPVNADGTLNLIAYGAWLIRELARKEHLRG
jgi:hypothetical protein